LLADATPPSRQRRAMSMLLAWQRENIHGTLPPHTRRLRYSHAAAPRCDCRRWSFDAALPRGVTLFKMSAALMLIRRGASGAPLRHCFYVAAYATLS